MAVQITKAFCSEMQRLALWYIHFPKSGKETAESIEQFKVFYLLMQNTSSNWNLRRYKYSNSSI